MSSKNLFMCKSESTNVDNIENILASIIMRGLFKRSINPLNNSCNYSVEASAQGRIPDPDLFSIIGFRTYDRKNKVIVYQRFTHRKDILESYLLFMHHRRDTFLNVDQHRNQKNYLVLVDETLINGLFDYSGERSCWNGKIIKDLCLLLSLNNTDENTMVEKLVSSIKHCIHLCDPDTMSKVLHLAFTNNYASIAGEIIHHAFEKANHCHYDPKWSSGFVNNTLLVIPDTNINKFLSCVRDKGYNINSGPQPGRDRTNTINYDLSLLDNDYLLWYIHNYKSAGSIQGYRNYSFFKRGVYPF